MGILDNTKKSDNKDAKSEKVEAAATKKASKPKTTVAPSQGTSNTKDAYRVLSKPLITEKSANEAELGKYHFEVFNDANKIMIKESIFNLYGVKPESVNIVCMKPKSVRFGRTKGMRKAWKKAIVTLKKGETINFVESV